MASKLESALMKQTIDRLEQNEAALKEEIELLKNYTLHEFTELSHLLQQEFNRLKENEQVQIEREFEKMKQQQLKRTRDEAARVGEALRQELTDLLRDKQSKTGFQLERTLMKREMDHLKKNDEVLKVEIELLKNNPARNCSLHEFTELSHLLQQEFNRLKENVKVQIEREFEKMKRQQLKRTQDEAARVGEALRQELTDLLRDKQSKTAFQLESTLMKREMDRLKQNDETLKREIELLRNKPVSNCSLQEIEILKIEFEKVKQQLKHKQDEASTAIAALKQELIEILRDKQSKTAFQLERTLMKREMDHLKKNDEALKREIDKMRTWSFQKHTNTTILIKVHEEQITQLTEKHESARRSILQDITQLRERLQQTGLEIAQLKQNELVFQRDIEEMKQKYESKAMSVAREMEELRHESQDLRKEAKQLKQNQLNLSNFCSQISYSAAKEYKTVLFTELLSGLAALMALAIICYLTFSLYYQQYQSKIDAESQRIDQLTRKQDTDQRNIDAQKGKLDAESQRIDQLTRKQDTDQRNIDAQKGKLDAESQRMDQLTKQQEADREHLVQEIDAQRKSREKVIENIDALRLRQEHVRTVFAEQHLPALIPFQTTMPKFFEHKSAGDIWYSKPFYTDPRGYKLCLAVHADGVHVDEGEHVSIFIYLMRGEFDDELMWPFRGTVTIYLLNQFEARGHREITFNSQGNGNRVMEGERASIGIGEECVVSYHDLSYMYDTQTQYLTYDSLRFRVANVEIKEDNIRVTPIDIIMTDFKGRKKNSEQWSSEPFYTHPRGYKMCLNVDPNGYGDGRGTHVTVYVTLMQGEHDDHLKWPFLGDITIKLLNQERDAGHREKTIPFDDRAGDDVAGRVWQRRSKKGWGIYKFIAHANLSTKDNEHVKNNCLRFKVLKVVVKSG